MSKKLKQIEPSELIPAVQPKLGRPSTYTEEIGDLICAKVAGGSNLNKICSLDEFPSRDCIYHWLKTNAAFADNYARSREIRADSRSDQIDDLIQGVIDGSMDWQAARVAIDALKWQAGKENPKKYGDTASFQVNIDKQQLMVVMPTAAEATNRGRQLQATAIEAEIVEPE